MGFYQELKNHIEAGIPALYIETAEWGRFHANLSRICSEKSGLNKKIKIWNPLNGLGKGDREDPDELIDAIDHADWDITVIEYADRHFKDKDTAIRFGALLRKLRPNNHQIIVVSPNLYLPSAIQNEFAILDFPLPDRVDIHKMLSKVTKGLHISKDMVDTASDILDTVKGLGSTEIMNAFAKVANKNGKITAEQIPELMSEKEQIIRKSGYLEYIDPDIKSGHIGGLDNLKEWLKQRELAFGSKAREKKLPLPKGVLLLGIPGTGKSLSAKAVADIWKKPLLRLDMGRVFGGLVGESESNMRNTIKVAESLEPCVLWVDEIEKGLSGGQGGERDGGTSTRVLGQFLTWMQEKKKEVFVFATANDISKLPPELLRKGRFDEIFFVDLPDSDTRKKIFEIHLAHIGQESVAPSDELIEKTEGYSGAEIETIVNDAYFAAYDRDQEEPTIGAQDLIDALKLIVPLSHTMKEHIKKLREWSEKRCRKASDGKPPVIQGDTPRLKQEEFSIFLNENEEDGDE